MASSALERCTVIEAVMSFLLTVTEVRKQVQADSGVRGFTLLEHVGALLPYQRVPAADHHCGCSPEVVGAGSFPHTLAESARLMPDTASPLPLSMGAHTGLIS